MAMPNVILLYTVIHKLLYTASHMLCNAQLGRHCLSTSFVDDVEVIATEKL